MSITGQDVVKEALRYLYIPYRFGAEYNLSFDVEKNPPKHLDCSELVELVLHILGIPFPDGSWNQYEACEDINVLHVAYHTPGALVFIQGSSLRVRHVGIATGTGCTIEARGKNSQIEGTGMVNIFPWRGDWDLAGLAPGVDYGHS